MARFEAERYIALTEQELKAARLILALAVTPFLFFLSTLGYMDKIGPWTKLVATLSILGLASGIVIWGVATMMCHLTLVSVEYERTKGVEGEALRGFVEQAWTKQNGATGKLFPRAAIAMLFGLATMTLFVLLVIWLPQS